MQRRIPQLDVVRGIAILLVIGSHASGKYPSLHLDWLFSDGWMGVDLFFALSGFLITGILLDTKGSEGYFKNFYARRCLRIWPLYYAALFFMFVIVPVLRPSEAATVFEPRSSPWWAYPLFMQNFLVPVPTNATGLLAVTWSLAIEEQFYLVWPLVVRYCSRFHLRCIALSVICVSPVLRLYLSVHGINIYSNVFCRLDGLMAGALLAVILHSEGFRSDRFVRLAAIGLCITAPLAFITEALHARWIVFSCTALASTFFICLALFSSHRGFLSLMKNRFLVYTGSISYGLYLIHKIPFDMAQTFHMDRHPILTLPAVLVVSYAAAILSRNVLERPFLRLKRFFEVVPSRPNLGHEQLVLVLQERGELA